MPNTSSAAKRVRQSAKARSLNLRRKKRVKEQIKSVLEAVQNRDAGAADAEFRKACSVLDKVTAKGTIHRNAAARRKSKLAKQIKAMKSQPAA